MYGMRTKKSTQYFMSNNCKNQDNRMCHVLSRIFMLVPKTSLKKQGILFGLESIAVDP